MEERSVRVYNGDKTFFSKISTTLSKILIPTRVGINSMMISIKRNNLLKAYNIYKKAKDDNSETKDNYYKKYEDLYALYLEAIDKYIMDSIYKKVKVRSATNFEENALSTYYEVTHLKEKQYMEYKYRKQKYLLELDYQNLTSSGKTKNIEQYNKFYIDKMDSLYKGIIKNYSIQLADSVSSSFNDKFEIYDKIFNTIEEYIANILNIKIENNYEESLEVLNQYDEYSKFLAGKLDNIDRVEKKMLLINFSRKLFTHSLPLVVAEQCYNQILNEIRSLVVNSPNEKKQNIAYKMLLTVLENYNINLLSTKIYWDKPKEREEYKQFYEEYKDILNKEKQKATEKEILLIKRDLKFINKEPERYAKVIKLYKTKLVEYGAMKQLKNIAITQDGKYKKIKM